MTQFALFAIAFCASLMLPSTSSYSYIRGPVSSKVVSPCPGLYCGRSQINESHNSECGQCQRGWKVGNNTHSLCQKCDQAPEMYDWLFLAFHVIFVTVLHFIAIDHRRRSFNREVIIMHTCALAEVTVAAVATLLINDPKGSLEITSCRVRHLSDWYSFLHNPNPNYEETLHCTQEVVYPLYTMIFMFYVLCGILMLILRPLVTSKFYFRRGKNAVYAALYFLPILAVIHAVAGGLVYISYPFIVFVLSVISSASHFAFKLDQSARALVTGCFKNSRDLIILIGHWGLHAFGILAITQSMTVFNLSLIALVPLPALFYVATAKFTDPVNFNNENS
jgi:hypothetical protein